MENRINRANSFLKNLKRVYNIFVGDTTQVYFDLRENGDFLNDKLFEKSANYLLSQNKGKLIIEVALAKKSRNPECKIDKELEKICSMPDMIVNAANMLKFYLKKEDCQRFMDILLDVEDVDNIFNMVSNHSRALTKEQIEKGGDLILSAGLANNHSPELLEYNTYYPRFYDDNVNKEFRLEQHADVVKKYQLSPLQEFSEENFWAKSNAIHDFMMRNGKKTCVYFAEEINANKYLLEVVGEDYLIEQLKKKEEKEWQEMMDIVNQEEEEDIFKDFN